MPLTRNTAQRIRACLWALLILAASPVLLADNALDSQRELFKRVYADVELGSWTAVDALSASERQSLEDYVLWPDLRAAWFRANLKKIDHGQVEGFLDHYGVLKPARELRYRYALHLARIGHLDSYLSIYQQFYQGLDVAKLDCRHCRPNSRQGVQHAS